MNKNVDLKDIVVKNIYLINQVDKINTEEEKQKIIEMNREHYKLLTLRENHSFELELQKEKHRHIEAMKDIEIKKIELEMLKLQSKSK